VDIGAFTENLSNQVIVAQTMIITSYGETRLSMPEILTLKTSSQRKQTDVLTARGWHRFVIVRNKKG